MNKFIKKCFYTFLVGLVLALIYILMNQSQGILLVFINGLSIVGIVYIIIGCSFLVFFGGFFRGTAHSIKKFFRTKSDEYSEQLWESSEASTLKKRTVDDLPNLKEGATSKQNEWTFSFLLIGIIFFVPALILGYLYY